MSMFLGIDWSHDKHDACFMNEAGAAIARLTIPHSSVGFTELDQQRQKFNLPPPDCLIAIETTHNLLLDYLADHGYIHVYVINPSAVAGSRHRYSQSGARTDQSDAYLLADILRQDRHRLQPWQLDSRLTRQLRNQASLLNYLTHSIVRLSNRLRAVLERYYPAALQAFSVLDTEIALDFVRQYDTPQAAASLTYTQFKCFAEAHAYSRRALLPARFARLQAPQPEADADTVTIFKGEAGLLTDLLRPLVITKAKLLKDHRLLFRQHPDAALFASLPGAGQQIAPGLLAKFGDNRERFPTPASVQALAGTCPVTIASGRKRLIRFRTGCDHEFRNLAQQWARASLRTSPWTQAYWQQARPHCDSNSHAYRCLANRWLAIAWKLWQSRQPYDEAYHLQQRAARSKPRA